MLDKDTRKLYRLIAEHGSDWVKKRICPREAALHALRNHEEQPDELRAEVERLRDINAAMSAQIAAVKHDHEQEMGRLRAMLRIAASILEGSNARGWTERYRAFLAAQPAAPERIDCGNGVSVDAYHAEHVAALTQPAAPARAEPTDIGEAIIAAVHNTAIPASCLSRVYQAIRDWTGKAPVGFPGGQPAAPDIKTESYCGFEYPSAELSHVQPAAPDRTESKGCPSCGEPGGWHKQFCPVRVARSEGSIE